MPASTPVPVRTDAAAPKARSLATSSSSAAPSRGAAIVLLATVAVSIALPHLPYISVLGWPLMLLSTLAHESGHGIAAWLTGGSFQRLSFFADGSGVATTASAGRLASAFVCAGGLVGPAVAAALLFVCARNEKFARLVLAVLSGVLLLGLLLVIRGGFGLGFVALLVALLAVAARYGSGTVARFVLVLLAVQLAIAVFSRADYLFTPVAQTAVGNMPSDVAQMSEALFLPYWFWGGLCAVISGGVLAFGLWFYLRPGQARVRTG